MFDNEKLYNLLASGHSAEDIVALFTSSLNEAEARIQAEAEERRAREAAAALEAQKREDFKELARHFFEVMARHYPDLGFTEDDITDEMCYAIGDIMMMSAQMDNRWPGIKVQVKRTPADIVEAESKKDDVFAKFFKQFGLS